MAERYRVTSLGVSPAQDRAHRMRFYFIAMSVRVVCVASLFFVRGWWILLAAAGAILLPYFAVILANAASTQDDERPEPPAPRELSSPPSDAARASADPSEHLIVIDAPAERRRGPRDAGETDIGPLDTGEREDE